MMAEIIGGLWLSTTVGKDIGMAGIILKRR